MTWQWLSLADVLVRQSNGKQLQQGWSPKCHDFPAPAGRWGVLKTTAIQAGSFLPEHNKDLPDGLDPKPAIEVRPGDLVMTCAGPRSRCGVPALVRSTPSKLMLSGKMYRFRGDERLVPEFLEAWLLSPGAQRSIDEMKTGISDSGLNLTHARFIRLPVPVPPLTEQRRIVKILEDHLSRLDAAQRYQEAAVCRMRSLRERLVLDAVTGVGRGDMRTACLPPVGTNDEALPDLADGWSWARIGDVAEVVGGVTKDSKKQNDPDLPEVPYLRVANVQRGSLRLDTVTSIRVPQAKVEQLRLEPGDVLLNEGGDRDKLARGWVWEGQIEQCIHQNHVFRARVTDDRIDPYFLSWTANTVGGRWAERNGKQSVNLASISLSMIRRMPVIVPPVGEASAVMARLLDQLDHASTLEREIAAAAARRSLLRRALLTAAFSGRLTGRDSDLDRAEELAEA